MLPFVGRRAELEAVKRHNAGQMLMPLFVFGPEGCGKSRLFREAVRRFREWYPDGEALLIDATVDDVDRVFAASSDDARREAVEEFVGALSQFAGAGPLSAPLGKLAARLYARLAKRVYGRARRALIVVDELVGAFGVADVDRVAKGMYHVTDVSLREGDRDRIVNFFVLTSEGESRRRLARHSYVWQAYVWNLPRGDFEELYYRVRELRPGPAPPFDEVWRLYGGNPRALEELAALGWDTGTHRRRLAMHRNMGATADLLRKRRLASLALRVVEDVDYLHSGEEAELLDLAHILVRANLVAELPRGIELGAAVGVLRPTASGQGARDRRKVRMADPNIQGTAEGGSGGLLAAHANLATHRLFTP